LTKLRGLCSKGDTPFEGTPEEIGEIVDKIERGEVEEFPKGKYLLFDQETKKIVGRYELGETQSLVIMPVIKGG
jgi:hypothetical protein